MSGSPTVQTSPIGRMRTSNDNNNNSFFVNEGGSAWLKFNPNGIKSKKDFWAISPYSEKGPRKSREIWRDEIGDEKRLEGQQKTYYGTKNYIYQRIAYNLSQTSQNLPTIWQQYDDFPSHDEAFDRADSMFEGRAKVGDGNNSYANRRRAQAYRRNKFGSQLNSNLYDNNKESSLPSLPREDKKEEEGEGEEENQIDEKEDVEPPVPSPSNQSEFTGVVIANLSDHNDQAFNKYQENNIPQNMKIENLNDETFISYPSSEIYWKCPNLRNIKYSDIRNKIKDRKGGIVGLDNLNGKKLYCGSDLNDYLRLKICYNERVQNQRQKQKERGDQKRENVDNQNLGLGEGDRISTTTEVEDLDNIDPERDAIKRIIDRLEDEFPQLKNLENFGNPGQCFAYGKVYKNPQLEPSYMFFTN